MIISGLTQTAYNGPDSVLSTRNIVARVFLARKISF